MKFRFATENDVDKVLYFIRQLAKYEKMEDEVVADEATLREWMFEKKTSEAIFVVPDDSDEPAGFALFFHNFSTFLGRAGLYLEDLFVLPEQRGNGYGKGLMKELARIAKERGYGRFEWVCLDWNQPSIDFYLSLDAEPMSDWTIYRLAGDALKKM